MINELLTVVHSHPVTWYSLTHNVYISSQKGLCEYHFSKIVYIYLFFVCLIHCHRVKNSECLKEKLNQHGFSKPLKCQIIILCVDSPLILVLVCHIKLWICCMLHNLVKNLTQLLFQFEIVLYSWSNDQKSIHSNNFFLYNG